MAAPEADDDERDLTRLDAIPPVPPPDAVDAPVVAAPPIDFSDTTYPHSATASPPTESELVIDVDASGETSAVDEDVILDDDADVVEDDEVEVAPPEPPKETKPPPGKRTIPPPLPRGS